MRPVVFWASVNREAPGRPPGEAMVEHTNGCDTTEQAMAANLGGTILRGERDGGDEGTGQGGLRSVAASNSFVAARLSDKDVSELRGLAERLAKGRDSLTEMLKDLELEREELEKEKVQLNETISLFMKDLQKLHIGSQNTVEPMLEEGPLDFVGRFWETVKPRDSAYVAGEHIGEIRKPGEKPTGPSPLAALKEAALAHELSPNVQQNVQAAQEKVQERVHEVAWLPWVKKAMSR
eukprot:Skav227608  [mRNA]  locus=scaffold1141:536849:539212:- [translate_table: standard]